MKPRHSRLNCKPADSTKAESAPSVVALVRAVVTFVLAAEEADANRPMTAPPVIQHARALIKWARKQPAGSSPPKRIREAIRQTAAYVIAAEEDFFGEPFRARWSASIAACRLLSHTFGRDPRREQPFRDYLMGRTT